MSRSLVIFMICLQLLGASPAKAAPRGCLIAAALLVGGAGLALLGKPMVDGYLNRKAQTESEIAAWAAADDLSDEEKAHLPELAAIFLKLKPGQQRDDPDDELGWISASSPSFSQTIAELHALLRRHYAKVKSQKFQNRLAKRLIGLFKANAERISVDDLHLLYAVFPAQQYFDAIPLTDHVARHPKSPLANRLDAIESSGESLFSGMDKLDRHGQPDREKFWGPSEVQRNLVAAYDKAKDSAQKTRLLHALAKTGRSSWDSQRRQNIFANILEQGLNDGDAPVRLATIDLLEALYRGRADWNISVASDNYRDDAIPNAVLARIHDPKTSDAVRERLIRSRVWTIGLALPETYVIDPARKSVATDRVLPWLESPHAEVKTFALEELLAQNRRHANLENFWTAYRTKPAVTQFVDQYAKDRGLSSAKSLFD